MIQTGLKRVKVKKFSSATQNQEEDVLAIEEPLQIQIAQDTGSGLISKNISITMRTPGHDVDLACGFLFTEGIIANQHDILTAQSINKDHDNVIELTLAPHVTISMQNLERNFYTTSSCGVCGKTSMESVKVKAGYKAKPDEMCLRASALYALPGLLNRQQKLFQHTGGLHASALFTSAGECQVIREDVGRHNALDKVIGSMLMEGKLPLNDTILMLSGRISFELVQKAFMAGIRMIAAVGAPSSLAVQMAEECGITLIGFLREQRFNVYTGFHRITV